MKTVKIAVRWLVVIVATAVLLTLLSGVNDKASTINKDGKEQYEQQNKAILDYFNRELENNKHLLERGK